MLREPPTTIVLIEQGFAGLIKDLWMHMMEQVIQLSHEVIKYKVGRHFCRSAVRLAYLRILFFP